jgi:hypothetical protein
VLGRSLDELSPQSRRLLLLIHQMVSERAKTLHMDRSDFRFSRREVREHSGWGHSQLALHLKRLEELEYLLVHRGGRGQSFVYELIYNGEGQDGGLFLMGLIDPDQLPSCRYDEKPVLSPAEGFPGVSADLPGSGGDLPGSIRPHSGGIPGSIRGGGNGSEPMGEKEESDSDSENDAKTHLRGNGEDRSHRSRTEPAVFSLAAADENQ